MVNTSKNTEYKIKISEPDIFFANILVVGGIMGIIIPKKLIDCSGWKLGDTLRVYVKKVVNDE